MPHELAGAPHGQKQPQLIGEEPGAINILPKWGQQLVQVTPSSASRRKASAKSSSLVELDDELVEGPVP